MSQPLVLIVDDNPENLSVIGELLQPAHAVRVANSGQRALQLARREPRPQLVLLDVMMPGMDGFEVLQQLRAAPETADIPVIFLTALNSAEDEARGLLMGAADYITKPIQPPVLLARVRTQLALRSGAAPVQQRWLEAELQRRAADNQRLQANALLAMARLATPRSPAHATPAWHIQARLQLLVDQLRRLPHDADVHDGQQVARLLQAAPWRDIGHLAVPDRVLHKPAALDAAERALVQAHARHGAEAIAGMAAGVQQALPLLACAQQIALHHHERWDGSGYPDGLAATAIPWAARLTAVADVYGALVSARPHRAALSHEAACQAVLAGRGRQFDPLVVDAFAQCRQAWSAPLPVPASLGDGASAGAAGDNGLAAFNVAATATTADTTVTPAATAG